MHPHGPDRVPSFPCIRKRFLGSSQALGTGRGQDKGRGVQVSRRVEGALRDKVAGPTALQPHREAPNRQTLHILLGVGKLLETWKAWALCPNCSGGIQA